MVVALAPIHTSLNNINESLRLALQFAAAANCSAPDSTTPRTAQVETTDSIRDNAGNITPNFPATLLRA